MFVTTMLRYIEQICAEAWTDHLETGSVIKNASVIYLPGTGLSIIASGVSAHFFVTFSCSDF